MTNPLLEAIERLMNPYAMQERDYHNRVDAQDARMQETVTPRDVIVIEDADHLKRVLDAATMPYDLRRALSGLYQRHK